MSVAPDTFLERIVTARRTAVATARRVASEPPAAAPAGRPGAFLEALDAAGPDHLAVIAELKRVSPAAGPLGTERDPVELARAYRAGGAAALSVLTEPDFFGALAADLPRCRKASGLPVLRKDFVVDPWQLEETAAWGAEAVLLMVVVLGEETPRYAERALALGIEPFVEVHQDAEMDIALASPARIIGINNRDLRTFAVEPGTAERLAPRAAAAGRRPIALSGIRGPSDLKGLRDAGIVGVLVGESLMRAPDPEAAVRALAGAVARVH